MIRTLLGLLGLNCLFAKKENGLKKDLFKFESRHSTIYANPFSFSSNIDIYQVMRARRKIHRGKMYRRFRGQRLTGKAARQYA